MSGFVSGQKNWFESVFIASMLDIEGSKLLIFDGHNSHMTLPLIDSALKYNVELLCLQAHTSHILQPLDVGIFKAVKNAWRKVLQDYYTRTGYKNVDKTVFPALLQGILSMLTVFPEKNAVRGFEGAGIFPINKEKILKKATVSAAMNDTNSPISSTSTNERTLRSSTPPPKNNEIPLLTPKICLEISLMSVLKQNKNISECQKRTRVGRKFAESLTSPEVRDRLAALEKKKLTSVPFQKRNLRKMTT
ncbi:DDE superfamily endonuclease [Popillia japonica]|uniref:DDE superfamily endonuclease n=1 Tax=Popillia japonica TaxID=7064 RepID=A0AAW1JDV0_POPJA